MSIANLTKFLGVGRLGPTTKAVGLPAFKSFKRSYAVKNPWKWRGYEEYLGYGLFVTGLDVYQCWVLPDSRVYVHGIITLFSARSDVGQKDIWFHAVMTDGFRWSIREMGGRDYGQGGVSLFSVPDQFPFTEQTRANHAIKRFIAGLLDRFVRLGEIEIVAKRNGHQEIRASDDFVHPSGGKRSCPEWLEMNADARWPSFVSDVPRCYLCTCGQRWWHQLPWARWVKVHSDAAWQMLIEHQGQAVRPVYQTADGIILMREHVLALPEPERAWPYVYFNQLPDRILDMQFLGQRR